MIYPVCCERNYAVSQHMSMLVISHDRCFAMSVVRTAYRVHVCRLRRGIGLVPPASEQIEVLPFSMLQRRHPDFCHVLGGAATVKGE